MTSGRSKPVAAPHCHTLPLSSKSTAWSKEKATCLMLLILGNRMMMGVLMAVEERLGMTSRASLLPQMKSVLCLHEEGEAWACTKDTMLWT